MLPQKTLNPRNPQMTVRAALAHPACLLARCCRRRTITSLLFFAASLQHKPPCQPCCPAAAAAAAAAARFLICSSDPTSFWSTGGGHRCQMSRSRTRAALAGTCHPPCPCSLLLWLSAKTLPSRPPSMPCPISPASRDAATATPRALATPCRGATQQLPSSYPAATQRPRWSRPAASPARRCCCTSPFFDCSLQAFGRHSVRGAEQRYVVCVCVGGGGGGAANTKADAQGGGTARVVHWERWNMYLYKPRRARSGARLAWGAPQSLSQGRLPSPPPSLCSQPGSASPRPPAALQRVAHSLRPCRVGAAGRGTFTRARPHGLRQRPDRRRFLGLAWVACMSLMPCPARETGWAPVHMLVPASVAALVMTSSVALLRGTLLCRRRHTGSPRPAANTQRVALQAIYAASDAQRALIACGTRA